MNLKSLQRRLNSKFDIDEEGIGNIEGIFTAVTQNAPWRQKDTNTKAVIRGMKKRIGKSNISIWSPKGKEQTD